MSNISYEQPGIGGITRTILFAIIALVLPGVKWGLFGWLHSFLPLFSFFVLCKYGEYSGRKLLLTAAVISLLIYLISSSIDLFIFSALLMLSGYVLFKSAEKSDSPAISGLKCFAAIAAGWVISLSIASIGSDLHGYSQLVNSLDQGVTEALFYYRQSDNISADTLVMLETTLLQMKIIVPIIMPAVLGSLILLMTWFTMVVGNLAVGKTNEHSPWPKYQLWELPEKLIWLAIAAGIFTVIPSDIFRMIGINGLILLSIIYCFQGLAIGVFYMTKWNVPILFRSFFYVMVIFQSFGTIVLLLTGIADIWFDFRKLKVDTTDQTNE